MATPLRLVSDVLPLTYAVDLGQHISTHAGLTSNAIRDVAILTAAVLLALPLAASSLRRRSA